MHFWRMLQVVLVALGAALLIESFEIARRWGTSLPRESNPQAERIVPLNNHGTVRYMTRAEERLLDGMQIAGGLAAGGAILN